MSRARHRGPEVVIPDGIADEPHSHLPVRGPSLAPAGQALGALPMLARPLPPPEMGMRPVPVLLLGKLRQRKSQRTPPRVT